MITEKNLEVSFLILCILNLCFGTPILQTSKGAVFEMEGNPEPGECTVCTKIYSSGQELSSGYFRLEWNRFSELDSTGTECCSGGGNCLYNVGCNQHIIPAIGDFFALNSTSSMAFFDGNIRAGGAQTQACTPPGTTLICVPFQFENVLNDQDVSINYNGMTIYPQSLRTTIRIFSWPFAAGSTGLKMRVLVMARLTTVDDFYKEPGHIKSTSESTNDFDGVAMVDDLNRQALIYFSKTAIVDNVTTTVDVTGLIATAYDDSGKYVDITFPVFTNSIEYTLNLLVPSVSGIDVPGGPIECGESVWCNNKLYFIIGFSVVGGTCCCFAFTCIYCRWRRFVGRSAKKAAYY